MPPIPSARPHHRAPQAVSTVYRAKHHLTRKPNPQGQVARKDSDSNRDLAASQPAVPASSAVSGTALHIS